MTGFVAMFTGRDRPSSPSADAAMDARRATRNGPVLILAGGTGGHIFPGIAVAQSLRERGAPVLWLGSEGGLETSLVPKAGIALRTLRVKGFRGKALLSRLAAPWRVARAVFAAWRLLGAEQPRSALSLGGFAAGPGGIAAWLRDVPLLVHEQNRVPGVTNRILSRFAKRRLCGFAGALAHGEWIGNPVRADIAAIAAPRDRYVTREGALRLLVLGGSQGAAAINANVPRVLAAIAPERRPLVRHQCGARHVDATRAAYALAGVEAIVDAFVDDMAAAYAWADLVVCRAGALTLAELCAAGLPAVLVPFPAAVDDHQTRNASALVEAGGARLVSEGDQFAQRLGEAASELLDGDLAVARARLLTMAKAARTLARPDAAARIADLCLEVAA
jgi:UDP-N-acetylglucosamine--N-acetylmuramyl-(pentapeptide) pyrophosphoryl-undecaprenol N-acetylglucosamine transferase